MRRFHAGREATPHGIAIRDLGSTSGTQIGATQVREVVVRTGVDLDVARTRIRLFLGSERSHVPLQDRVHPLLGDGMERGSARTVYAEVARRVVADLTRGINLHPARVGERCGGRWWR